MAWAKLIDRATGVFHYDSTPDAWDLNLWQVVPIVQDRAPEGLEQVGADGNIFIAVDDQRAALWERAKALRDQHKVAGVTIANVGTVQTDDVSTQNITGLVVMAQVAIANGQPFSEPFTLADNSVVTFDAAGMIGMGVAVGQFVSAVYARARDLRTQLDAATTLEALAAIDVTAGWP